MTDDSLRVLVFTRTCGFRHESTPEAVAALDRIARERGWSLEATDDPAVFSDEGLRDRAVVVFLSTAGTVLDAGQKLAFERWVCSGKGFVGVHGATNTEYEWPLYGKLVGAYFRTHPAIQPATVVVERPSHPTTRMLPARFTWVDEWYAFVENPRPNVEVLLSLDESSYSPGADGMGADHPLAWCHEVEGTRAFYTALGHTAECWADPLFVAHVAAGIEWAGG
jgi:type 1 glutamine amidotransferase